MNGLMGKLLRKVVFTTSGRVGAFQITFMLEVRYSALLTGSHLVSLVALRISGTL